MAFCLCKLLLKLWFLSSFSKAIIGGTYIELNQDGLSYYRLMTPIITSPYDTREYRVLILKNRLKLLLISDPSFQKATAAMDVDTGYRDDPSYAAGLAHLVEHLLFTGSEQFPELNGFEEFAKTCGGHFNAETAYDHTTYYFTVGTNNLKGALERFASMFIAPRFTWEGLEQELSMVDQEYVRNCQVDSIRVAQIVRSLSLNHSFAKFPQGNRDTLQVEGRNILRLAREFFKANYSPSQMRLVVAGKDSLNELTDMVVPLFSQLNNKFTGRKPKNDNPYLRGNFNKIIRYVPVANVTSIDVLFFLPGQQELYDTKPARYLTTLIGRQHRGSPSAILSSLGLATDLKCEIVQDSESFTMLAITIATTPKGLEKYTNVLEIIFQDIRLLQRNATWSWHYDQSIHLGRIEFEFMEPPLIGESIVSLAKRMQHSIPVEHVLQSENKFLLYDHQLIEETLQFLSPAYMT